MTTAPTMSPSTTASRVTRTGRARATRVQRRRPFLSTRGVLDVRARHQQSDRLAAGGRRHDAGDPTVVHDRDPVAQGEDLVELGGDHQDRLALVALLDHLAVYVLDRSHVEPAGGLGGDEGLEGLG